MSSKILILGARGRFGRAARTAFAEAGWAVTAFARAARPDDAADVQWHYGDAFDARAVTAAARGVDVIVNALNPPYERWASDVPRITHSVISAARASKATVLLPGNVYNFGAHMPPVLTEETPHRPTTRKGRLREELERGYRAAADTDGVRTIVVRAGDFIEREQTSNWFDTYIAHQVHTGTITYPGRVDIDHAWAYLPDLARAAVGLVERRNAYGRFVSIGFPGHTFSGDELRRRAEAILERPIRLKTFPWTLMRGLSLFSRAMREVLEMRYLWDVPHRIDPGSFEQALPDFRPTSLDGVLRDAWQVNLSPPAEASTPVAARG